MASLVQNSFKGRLMGDTAQIGTAINLATDTIKAMLLTSSHTQNADTNVFISEVSANEVSASGSYPAGGVTLTKSSSTDDSGDKGVFDATDLAITSFTGTARYLAIYKDTGTPSTSPICGIIDFGSDVSSFSDTFTITFNANGVITLA